MKRTPMPRGSGFAAKHPPRLAKVWDSDRMPGPRATVCRIEGLVDRAVVAVPKRQYIRSPALMEAYRTIPCQHCGAEDGTVCGAHSNWSIHAKAKGIKADDSRCASLCFRCHSDLDSGSTMTERERQLFWWPAHTRTILQLCNEGKWPKSVPVPELTFPKEWA